MTLPDPPDVADRKIALAVRETLERIESPRWAVEAWASEALRAVGEAARAQERHPSRLDV